MTQRPRARDVLEQLTASGAAELLPAPGGCLGHPGVVCLQVAEQADEPSGRVQGRFVGPVGPIAALGVRGRQSLGRCEAGRHAGSEQAGVRAPPNFGTPDMVSRPAPVRPVVAKHGGVTSRTG